MINLKAGEISFDEWAVFYRYLGKGGVRGRGNCRVPLSSPYSARLPMSARTCRPCSLRSRSGRRGLVLRASQPVPSTTALGVIRRWQALPLWGLHVLRHTAAKLRRDVGESVESVSQFLDHSSLAVTTTYLRRLEGERDGARQGVATVLGLS